MLKSLIAAIILVPLAELYLLVLLGRHFGLGPTLAWLVLSGLLGALLARRQGQRVMTGWRASLARGEVPEEGLLGSALVLLGGALLIAPGILTDAVGLLLLLPPTRRLVARRLRRSLERQMRAGAVRVTSFHVGGPFPGGPFGVEEPRPSGDEPSPFPGSPRRRIPGEVDAEFTSDEDPRG